MYYKLKIFVFLSLLSISSLSAQNCILTKDGNLLSDSSEIELLQIPYFHAGHSGDNVTWDMSCLSLDGEAYNIYLLKDTLNRHIVMTNTDAYYYSFHNGTLSLVKHENPLNKFTYVVPQLQIKYPFTYGDSITTPFKIYGVYCGDHPFKEQGVSTIMADAMGNIILNDDTIKNVLRVYTLRSYSICMTRDSAAIDSAAPKQIIDERYDWYARGYRYPIFTTISSTSFDNLSPIGTTHTAYCMLPVIQRLSSDLYNENIRYKDSMAVLYGIKDDLNIFHHSVTTTGKQLTISYSLNNTADITALVSDPMGIVYWQKKVHNDRGDGFAFTIDCGDLRRGQYVLYLNVNGIVYNEKLSIK